MRSLQRPINDGGIKFSNRTTYCDLIYISNLFQCFKTREKNNPFNTKTYFIEFEIRLSLSKLYDPPILNHIPHRDYPTPYYQKTRQILKEYKITLEELTKGKIKQIYYRISYPDKRPSHQETFRLKLVNQNILPNYLKTFIIEQSVISCPLALNQVNEHCACNFRIQLFTCLPGAVSLDKFELSFKKSLAISLKHPSHSITLHPLISTSR